MIKLHLESEQIGCSVNKGLHDYLSILYISFPKELLINSLVVRAKLCKWLVSSETKLGRVASIRQTLSIC